MEQAATSKPASPAVSGDEAVQQPESEQPPPRPCSSSISKVDHQPPAPAPVAVAARTMAVCRICLASGVRSMVSIHRPVREYTGKTLLSMLLTVCMPLNNRREADGGGGGGLPESICRSCQWKLLSAYDLYVTTLASDNQLRSARARVTDPNDQEQPDKGALMLDATESSPAIKLEMPDDDDMYDDMYRPEVELKLASLQDDPNQLDETIGGAMETGDPGDLLDESKFSIPDTKESFIDEHYQYDTGSGNHVCGLCSQDFPYKSQCRVHIAAKHNPAKPFKCDTCFCTLTSLQRLQRHKIVSHGEGQIKQQDAIEEQNDCTGDTMYVCPICAKKFSSSVRFRRHKSVHAVHKRPFKCDICLYRFPSKSQLTQHAKVHREPTEGQDAEAGPLLPCDQCDEMFSGKRLLTIHQRKVHGRPGGRTEDGRERTDYSCIICNESFARESVLNTHMKMHELLAAEKDKEKRLDLERLVKQELQHQMGRSVPPLPPLSPEVPDHAHSVLEPFALGLVPVVKDDGGGGGGDGVEDGTAAQPSTTFGSLNNNSFISFNNNNSRKMATLGAAAAAAAKKKIIIPTDIAYVCSVCEQEFDKREQLKKHQKRQHRKLKVDIVTTEAPCNGGSGVEVPRNLEPPPLTAMPGLELKLMNGSIKRHSFATYQTPDKMDDDLMIIDSDDETKPNDSKPLLSSTPSGSAEGQNASSTPSSQIRCELCHKTFTYNCYLTMHMRKNHDESKPYGCKVCHYRFGYRGTLLRHQLIHSSQSVRPGGHGSIIFKCRICSAKFLELMHLNKHLKVHRQPTEPPVAETSGQVQLIRCSECTQIFSDRVQFEEHEQKEHKPKSERGTFRPATTTTSSAGDHRSSSLSQRMQGTPSASSSPFTSSGVKNKLNFDVKDEQTDDYLTDISIIKVEPAAN